MLIILDSLTLSTEKEGSSLLTLLSITNSKIKDKKLKKRLHDVSKITVLY